MYIISNVGLYGTLSSKEIKELRNSCHLSLKKKEEAGSNALNLSLVFPSFSRTQNIRSVFIEQSFFFLSRLFAEIFSNPIRKSSILLILTLPRYLWHYHLYSDVISWSIQHIFPGEAALLPVQASVMVLVFFLPFPPLELFSSCLSIQILSIPPTKILSPVWNLTRPLQVILDSSVTLWIGGLSAQCDW